ESLGEMERSEAAAARDVPQLLERPIYRFDEVVKTRQPGIDVVIAAPARPILGRAAPFGFAGEPCIPRGNGPSQPQDPHACEHEHDDETEHRDYARPVAQPGEEGTGSRRHSGSFVA